MELGKKIKDLREKAGLTQEELAEKMNVQRNTVWRWENQKANLKASNVQKLSEILKVEPSELIDNADDENISLKSLLSPINVDTKEYITEQINNRNITTMTFKNGATLITPATPEGFAFLKDLFALSMQG